MTTRCLIPPWPIRIAIVLLVLGLATPHVLAWNQLRHARIELARYHPAEARRAIELCRKVWGWGDSSSTHLLACRAAWQDGDIEAAGRELRDAQRQAGGATDDTALEWALLQAASGNVTEIEEYLQRRVERSGGAEGPIAFEALCVGYLRNYRILDAKGCLDIWLARDENNVRALELRGQTFVTGKGVERGASDFRRVLELDSSRLATQRRLVEALIVIGGYEEAVGHIESLRRVYPDDATLAARLAQCYNFVGRRDEARTLIDETLQRHPDDGLALRTRGQLALMDDRKTDAERDLKRALTVIPDDYQSNFLLAQTLQQQGKQEEAKRQLQRAEELKERNERLSELTSRKLAEHPLDPDLRFEIGSLLLKSGSREAALNWFLSALNNDPNHQPTHAALADYFERFGDKARAQEHRSRLRTGAIPPGP